MPPGVNPKSWKLARAVAGLPEDAVIVVVDDDTVLSQPGLDALLEELASGAMVATGLPEYLRRGTRVARFIADWVNGQAATTYLGLPGHPISVNGMCVAMRVGTLRELGGFEAIERCVVDDLALARLVRAAGGRIGQTRIPQRITTSVDSLRAASSLLHRWMVFAILAIRLEEGLSRRRILVNLVVPPALMLVGCVALCANAGVSARARVAGVASILVARAALMRLGQRFAGTGPEIQLLSAVITEMVVPLFAPGALINPNITWRGRPIQLDDDGMVRS